MVGNVGENNFTAVYNESTDNITEIVTVKVNPKPITVSADDMSKTYGENDPEFTYTIDKNTSLVDDDTLRGELTRETGENVDDYTITQGTLTNENNPNYAITFNNGTFKINPADINYTTTENTQSIVAGIGTFKAPTFVGVDGKAVEGAIIYTYNGNPATADEITAALAALKAGENGTIGYSFTPTNSNYKSATGTIDFTIINMDFTVSGEAVTAENAVTIKSNPTYGDTWEDIIELKPLTIGIGSESATSGFSLVQTGKPTVGENTFSIVFNGTIGGKEYTNIPIVSGTVNIAKKEVTITADSWTIKVGDPLPTYSYKATGLVNGETLPIIPQITCSAADSKTAGVYDIIVRGDIESANYKFSYVNGKLTVSEKPVVAAPVINPNGGTFSGSQTITITCGTEGADVYYTTDGNDPTTASTKYDGAFTVSKTTTVKAIAVKDGMTDSDVVSATFTKESSGGSSGGSGGYRPSRPSQTKIKNPIVYGNEIPWYEVSEIIRTFDTGGELLIDLNGNTTVPAYVIEDIANKDAVITFMLNTEVSFVVDGANISGKVSDIDLAVGKSRTKLSKTNFSVIGGTAEKQFTLGNIGVHAKIDVALDKKYAGKFASLMKLNHETRKYKFVSVAKIGTDGKALLDINGKGDYLLIIDSETKKPGDFNNDMLTNAKDVAVLLKNVVYELSMNDFKADYNSDGKVNALDAYEILKLVLGLVHERPR